jgi:hypothetical protein
MSMLRLLVACAVLDAACGVTPAQQQQQQLAIQQQQAAAEADAAKEREARAQKSLTDSLTDALAMLKHGSARAKESAAAGIANLAVETTISQPYHPVTFRNACVRAGLLEELVRLLLAGPEDSTEQGKFYALAALEAIATDDPSTELDNGHALATCQAGAVPPVVRLLSSANPQVQVGAAGCVAVLAENPQCQTMLLKEGAVQPLLMLGTYGSDAAKLKAVAALDLLALNNPAAHTAIVAAGGKRLLEGLQRFGGTEMKEATSELLEGVKSPDKLKIAADTASHARQAHQARLKHSKVLNSAFGMQHGVQRAQAPQRVEHDEP